MGHGPSSSHTMGPASAAQMFKKLYDDKADSYIVTLYGSLAATGKGHMTDVAIENELKPKKVSFVWKGNETLMFHVNGMTIKACQGDREIGQETYYSVGGGAIIVDSELNKIEGPYKKTFVKAYNYSTMNALLRWCRKSGLKLNDFVYQSEGDDIKDFTRGMITKSIKLGCDKKIVNSVIPNLIPTFEIQLGTSVEKCKLIDGTYISISHKMNGTRCVYLNNQMKSRQNKLYNGLDHIIDDIKKLRLEDYFIDGELTYKNEEGLSDSDAFQKGCSIAMSKDTDKSQLKLVIFDIFPAEEFLNLHTSKKTYKERRKDLDKLEESIDTSGITNLSVVERLYEGTDHSQIWKWLDYADVDMGWEGIMINLDTPYECKRTKNLIKVKRFFEKDLRCIKVNIATTGKYKGIMGSITCNYFDNTVDIGSGFNDEQRKYYAKHPEEIIGKIVSCKYKEETQNKDGGKSLQFPVYMGILIDRDKAVDEN